MPLPAHYSICKLIVCFGLLFQTISAQDRLSVLTADIKAGPSVYYSSDAYSYFTRFQQNIAPQVDKETAFKCYRAAMALANMGSKAIAAVPVLIDSFPKAYHACEIRNAQYAGEGTFEDWVQTYITNERNKFLLASPFLDYNSMSACESYIESSHEIQYLDKSAGNRSKVNITIILTLHVGACTLEKITGMTFGKDASAWRKWWDEQGSTLLSGEASITPVASGPVLSSGQVFSEIVEKGKYRMSLSTGDELVGIVESKDDTSLILETTEGKPFAFSHRLLSRYELLALPPKKNKPVSEKALEINERETISYDDLKNKSGYTGTLEVKISNGSIFKGTLVSIDESMLTINIEGSHIPIAKGVVSQINLIPQSQNPVQTEKKPKKQSPFDTVFVKSQETDEYGKPKQDIIFVGSIISMNNEKVSFKTADDSAKQIDRAQITRIIKHTANNYEETIKRYAKPLFCPDDMFMVDIPPGKQGRPFFKSCVDRFEYPNRRDGIPQGNLSYADAQKFCKQQGKRLCTQDEWQWACSGFEGYTYPYGWNRDDNKCNTGNVAERSGSRLNCVSKFGGFDMVGNIFEWVSGNGNNEPMLMGGPYSKCQTVSPGVGGGAKPQTGFRCCKSN